MKDTKKSSKILSVLLTLLMLVSMPGVTSFAETLVNTEESRNNTVLYADGTLVINENTENITETDAEKIICQYSFVEDGFDSKEKIPWHSNFEDVQKIKFGSETKPLSMARWFSNLPNLKSIDLQNLDTSQTTDCTELFANTISDCDIQLKLPAECNLENMFLNSNVNAHIITINEKDNDGDQEAENLQNNSVENKTDAINTDTIVSDAIDIDTVDVILEKSEHGSLSFADTVDKSKTIPKNSKIKLVFSAEDGFIPERIEINYTDIENNESIYVNNNEIELEARQSCSITAYFTTPDTGAKVKKEKKPTLEEYILKNMDRKYVGKGEELIAKDALMVTVTTADGSKLKEKSIDGLWAEGGEALTGQGSAYTVLYEVSPKADYYVARVGTEIENSRIIDFGGSEHNTSATMRNDIILDKDNGLAYVPKKYTKYDEKGNPMIASSRVQILYETINNEVTACTDVEIGSENVKGRIADNGVIKEDVNNLITEINIAENNKARNDIKSESFDMIKVNGVVYQKDTEAWSYDSNTGKLTINISPIVVHTVEVGLSNNNWKTVKSIAMKMLPEAAYAYSDPGVGGSPVNVGEFILDKAPTEGEYIKASGEMLYADSGRKGYARPAGIGLIHGGREPWNFNIVLRGDLGAFKSGTPYTCGDIFLARQANLPAGTYRSSSGQNISIPAMKLDMICAHINNASEVNATISNSQALIRIMSVSGNTAVIGVINRPQNTQAGVGFYQINWKKKAPAKTYITTKATKDWVGISQESDKPDSITYSVDWRYWYADGSVGNWVTGYRTLTGYRSNNYAVENKDVYHDSDKNVWYQYRIRENPVAGYKTTVSETGSNSSGKTYHFTNTRLITTKATKDWVGVSNTEKPDSITYYVDWREWYKGGSVGEWHTNYRTLTGYKKDNYVVSNTDVYCNPANNVWYQYRIREAPIDGYDITVSESGSDFYGKTYHFTNTKHGKVTLKKKVASNEHLVKNCPQRYNLKGAEYSVYKTEADALNNRASVGKLITTEQKTGADGMLYAESNSLALPPGDYWIKETKAPEGYYKDNKMYSVSVTNGNDSVVNVSDKPQFDPLKLKLSKHIPAGKNWTKKYLKDAEYTVKYYPDYYSTEKELSNAKLMGVRPLRTWVFATDAGGNIVFQEDNGYPANDPKYHKYHVGGHPLFRDSDGKVVGLYGTYVFEETKAPPGFIKNDGVTIRQIHQGIEPDYIDDTNHGDAKNVAAEDLENPTTKSLTVGKKISKDNVYKPYGYPTAIFEIKGTDVYGKTIIYHEAVTLDESTFDGSNYYAEFTLNNLPAGEYRVSEIKTSRYKFKNATVMKGEGTLTGETVLMNLINNHTGKVVFENEISRWNDYSHSHCIINQF